jgi:hypothetical protein
MFLFQIFAEIFLFYFYILLYQCHLNALVCVPKYFFSLLVSSYRSMPTPGGWETFLAYEDAQQDILIGLLRLRKCSPGAHREELKHVY